MSDFQFGLMCLGVIATPALLFASKRAFFYNNVLHGIINKINPHGLHFLDVPSSIKLKWIEIYQTALAAVRYYCNVYEGRAKLKRDPEFCELERYKKEYEKEVESEGAFIWLEHYTLSDKWSDLVPQREYYLDRDMPSGDKLKECKSKFLALPIEMKAAAIERFNAKHQNRILSRAQFERLTDMLGTDGLMDSLNVPTELVAMFECCVGYYGAGGYYNMEPNSLEERHAMKMLTQRHEGCVFNEYSFDDCAVERIREIVKESTKAG